MHWAALTLTPLQATQLKDSQVQQVVGAVMDGVQQLDSLLCHLATVPFEQGISETCRAMPCQSHRMLLRQRAASLGSMRGKVSGAPAAGLH